MCLFYKGTALGKINPNKEGPKFSHIGISLDADLTKMYTLGTLSGDAEETLSVASIADKTYTAKDMKYALYVSVVTSVQWTIMRDKLDGMIKNNIPVSYDFSSMREKYIGLSDSALNRAFCADIVTGILNSGEPIDVYYSGLSNITPETYMNAIIFRYVSGGSSALFRATETKILSSILVAKETKKRICMFYEAAYIPSLGVHYSYDKKPIVTDELYEGLEYHVENAICCAVSEDDDITVDDRIDCLLKLYFIIEMIDKILMPGLDNSPELYNKFMGLRTKILTELPKLSKVVKAERPDFNLTYEFENSRYNTVSCFTPCAGGYFCASCIN